VAAALRCQQGGLDGVELYMAGHFVDSFLSPLTKLCDDELNGSLERRLTFLLRVVRAVREAVRPDYIVGMRMSMDEARPAAPRPRRVWRRPAGWRRRAAWTSTASCAARSTATTRRRTSSRRWGNPRRPPLSSPPA